MTDVTEFTANLYGKYRQHFDAANSFQGFLDSLEADRPQLAEHWRKYASADGWLSMAFETAKAHPGSFFAKPLWFPRYRSIAEIFSEARLCAKRPGEDFFHVSARGTGPKNMENCAAWCGSIGATERYVRRFQDGTACKGTAGGTFVTTWVKPHADVMAMAEKHLFGGLGSFDAITRADGVLITTNDSHSIGNRWVSLLPHGETVAAMYPQDDLDAWARSEAADRAAWDWMEPEPHKPDWSKYAGQCPIRDR